LHVLCTVTQPLGGSGLLTHDFRIYYNFPAFEGKNVVTNGSQSSQQTTGEICLYEMKKFPMSESNGLHSFYECL
jgi:hypothetical protein